MPPRVKYTKAQIVDVAYNLVRKNGEQILSARTLASELHTSTAPIFTAFSSIEELKSEVWNRACALYQAYLEEGLAMPIPPKGCGLKYIQFAKDEPELFKMLFMCKTASQMPSHYFPGENENEKLVRTAFENTSGLSTEKAKKIYNHLAIYVHGLAVMYAMRQNVFTDGDIDKMLTEVFTALMKGE